MFARLLLIPFVCFMLVFLYLAWTKDESYAPWMIPFLIPAAIVFILTPQINWWWYNKYPADLGPDQKRLVEQYVPFYQRLTQQLKLKFRQRVGLFIMGTDWTPMGFPEDNLPPDIQLMLAAQAVTVTFGQEKFLFPKFEKIIVYPLAFPSPEHDYPHASELHEPDGCLLFSADQLIPAFKRPGSMYNIGLHEFAKAFQLTYPEQDYPALDDPDTWDRLQAAGGMSRAHVESVVGLAGLEPYPVAVHHYFTFPERFQAVFPEEYSAFRRIFKA